MDTKVVGDVKVVVIYPAANHMDHFNEFSPKVFAWELAEFQGENSPLSAKIATIGQTEAASLLNNEDVFQNALNNAIAKQNGWNSYDPRLIEEVNKILKGETAAEGAGAPIGLWEQKAIDFINSNVTSETPIKTISL